MRTSGKSSAWFPFVLPFISFCRRRSFPPLFNVVYVQSWLLPWSLGIFKLFTKGVQDLFKTIMKSYILQPTTSHWITTVRYFCLGQFSIFSSLPPALSAILFTVLQWLQETSHSVDFSDNFFWSFFHHPVQCAGKIAIVCSTNTTAYALYKTTKKIVEEASSSKTNVCRLHAPCDHNPSIGPHLDRGAPQIVSIVTWPISASSPCKCTAWCSF